MWISSFYSLLTSIRHSASVLKARIYPYFWRRYRYTSFILSKKFLSILSLYCYTL